MPRSGWIAVLAALLASSAWSAPAQDGPKPPKPRASPVATAPLADVPADDKAEKYTLETLKKQLEEMGFQVELSGDYVNVEMKKGDDVTFVYFWMDDHLLWLCGPLVHDIVNLDQVPAKIYWNLLKANDEHGPIHFSIDAEEKSLLMFQALPKRRLDAQAMQKLLTNFDDVMQKTRPLWDEPFRSKEDAK